MGRSSKFIASEVRLRFPSWKAWAFVSIALCPAFAGADPLPLPPNVVPPNVVHSPPSIPTSIVTLNAAVVPPPRFNATALPIAKLNNNAVPGGVGGPAGGLNVFIQTYRPNSLGGNPTNGGGTPNGGGTALLGGGASVPSQGGGRADARVSRAYAPGSSYGSNTVCGRYPYPACH